MLLKSASPLCSSMHSTSVLLKLWAAEPCLPGRGLTPEIYILFGASEQHENIVGTYSFYINVRLKSIHGHHSSTINEAFSCYTITISYPAGILINYHVTLSC